MKAGDLIFSSKKIFLDHISVVVNDRHKLFFLGAMFYYPCATLCVGDIVTLLWFRVSVRPSVRPCMDLVNTIETIPLRVSLSNLADILTLMRG